MLDCVLSLNEAVHTVEAISPAGIGCTVELLKFQHQMRSTRRPKRDAYVGASDPCYLASCRVAPQFPCLCLEVTMDGVFFAGDPYRSAPRRDCQLDAAPPNGKR
jgi:hypothetical protein